MNKEQEKLLWRYIDCECDPSELEQVEIQLEEDSEFFENYMLCLQLHAKFNKIHQVKGRKKEDNEKIDLSFLDDLEMKHAPAILMREFSLFKIFTSILVAFLWVTGYEMIKYIYTHAGDMSILNLILAYTLMSFISLYIPLVMYKKIKKYLFVN